MRNTLSVPKCSENTECCVQAYFSIYLNLILNSSSLFANAFTIKQPEINVYYMKILLTINSLFFLIFATYKSFPVVL